MKRFLGCLFSTFLCKDRLGLKVLVCLPLLPLHLIRQIYAWEFLPKSNMFYLVWQTERSFGIPHISILRSKRAISVPINLLGHC